VNISRFAAPAERAAALEQTKEAVLGILDAALVDKYFESSDLRREAQPRFSLPWSATPEAVPLSGKTLLKLRSRRTLNLRLDPNSRIIEFTAQGQTWRFPVLMKVLLEAIKKRRCHFLRRTHCAGQNLPRRSNVARVYRDTRKGGDSW
jgi:hypothetical protein